MTALIAVALAGAVGAPARVLLDRWVTGSGGAGLPRGTLVVNVTGSFVLGLVTGLGLYHGFHGLPKTVVGAGFCGAYTTFSTFSYETVRLSEEGSLPAALLNVASSLALGLAAAGAGLGLALAL